MRRLQDWLARIEANLDDLQSGVEATARAAETLRADASRFNSILSAPLARTIEDHVLELRECAQDQQAALRELRDGVRRLRSGLQRPKDLVRPPPPDSDRRAVSRERSR